MKKILLSFFLATASLTAAPQAVVFDWGNVIAFDDRSIVVDFMCETFKFSGSDFEQANIEKRKAVKAGKSDVDFWIQFAKEKEIQLPADWPDSYISVLKASVGADPKMYVLIDELKNKQIRVGLLSNINDRYTKLIRDFGFYDPFNPCLLSCEIGLEKPDQKAYELLLKTMNLPPKDVIFIDDKVENVESAKKMGIDAIVFESEEQVRLELTKRPAVTASTRLDRSFHAIFIPIIIGRSEGTTDRLDTDLALALKNKVVVLKFIIISCLNNKKTIENNAIFNYN